MTTPDEYKVIADNVRRLRQDLGLSQEELAARSGHTRFTIGTIEAGRAARASTLRHIAKALGTDLATLRRQPTPTRTREQTDLMIEAAKRRVALLRQAVEDKRERDAAELVDELERMLEGNDPIGP